LPIDAQNQTALLGDTQRREKKIRERKLAIIDAANLNRIAYQRSLHRCVNKLAQ
jgi:hypothetical protein